MNKTLLLELAKKMNIPRRNCMKTKQELEGGIKDTITRYKEVIFGPGTLTCMTRIDELRRQQVIDQKVYNQRLMEDTVRKLTWEGLQRNFVMDSDKMIDKRTGEVLDPEVDTTFCKDKFEADFDSLYRPRAEGLHILNGIGTLHT